MAKHDIFKALHYYRIFHWFICLYYDILNYLEHINTANKNQVLKIYIMLYITVKIKINVNNNLTKPQINRLEQQ